MSKKLVPVRLDQELFFQVFSGVPGAGLGQELPICYVKFHYSKIFFADQFLYDSFVVLPLFGGHHLQWSENIKAIRCLTNLGNLQFNFQPSSFGRY